MLWVITNKQGCFILLVCFLNFSLVKCEWSVGTHASLIKLTWHTCISLKFKHSVGCGRKEHVQFITYLAMLYFIYFFLQVILNSLRNDPSLWYDLFRFFLLAPMSWLKGYNLCLDVSDKKIIGHFVKYLFVQSNTRKLARITLGGIISSTLKLKKSRGMYACWHGNHVSGFNYAWLVMLLMQQRLDQGPFSILQGSCFINFN